MSEIPEYIFINGQRIDRDRLAAIDNEAIRQFLALWWDEHDYIEQSTSGSTGTPKIIRIAKQKMINSARMTLNYFKLQKNDDVLLCLPASYIAGRMMIVRAILGELNLTTLPADTRPLSHLSTPEHFDFAAMIPVQVTHSINENKSAFENIAQVIIGGGEISFTLQQKIRSLKNNCFATYGMTETITHIAVRKLNGTHPQESFQLLKGIRVDQDERNCLIIDAPKLNDEKLITNDVVEFTDLDKFKWLGRFDHVINSGGIKIHPEILEEKIASLITDRRYFITSLPHEELGSECVLLLEGAPLDPHTEKLLLNHLRELLEKHQSPRKILYSAKFHETETGKIKRKETLSDCQPSA